MKQTFLSILALAFPVFAFAQPMPLPAPPILPDAPAVIVVPKPAAAKWTELQGEFPLTRLQVPGDKPAKWELIDTVGAELEACESGRKASLVVSKEGRYRLLLTTDAGSVRLAVTVGKPIPPDPVIPPTPPVPVDPLVGKLQGLYTADTGAAKVSDLAALVELYSQAVDLVSGTTPPVSVADLLSRLKLSATLLKVKNLDGVRKAIADELKAVFPNDSPFDSTTQTKATAVLTRVRDALKAIK